jgi:ATP-dependent DNA helicase RecQ
MQEDIIQSVLNGNDTLALLPTGGGKSLCFQVPALARPGVCIVVSPLIALMKDQVQNLLKRNIKAVAIYSGMNSVEIDNAIDNCVYGDYRFLYLSPERLTTEIIRFRIPKMKVNLLAIDEAHCISQWGYDFRPPYLRIAEIRQLLPDTPVLALTATATPGVIDDICQKLEFKNQKIFRKSFERKNLTYAVIKEENKLERLLTICSKVPGTGVVYVRNRRKTKEIADFLNKNNISADFYHAGLDTRTRDEKQLNWTRDKLRVIVCTNAFGMGIDKPNVRFVVHMDLPDTPEAYFQEAGRAGRDEKKAYAVLLFNNSDIIDLDHFFENSYPPPDFIRQVYNALGNYFHLAIGSGKDKGYEFLLGDFCSHYNFERITTFNALKFLEKEGYILMSDALSNPSKLMLLLNNEDLYRFMVANKSYEILIKTLLRSYTGLFTAFTRIDENEISRRLKVETGLIMTSLKKLHQMRVLHYEPQNLKPLIYYTLPRTDIKDVLISPENYAERKKFAKKRLEAIKQYVVAENKCRSLMLLEYFGETTATECGICDVCLKRNKTELSTSEYNEIIGLINPLLKSKDLTTHELLREVKTNIPEKRILMAIRWLLDCGKLTLEPGSGKMRWNTD